MDVFQKCSESAIRTDGMRAAGVYPYYRVIQSAQDPVVLHEGRELVMLGSNNYLGLTNHPEVKAAAAAALALYGTGCAGSRLLNGTLEIHVQLEERLAAVHGARGGAHLLDRLPGQPGRPLLPARPLRRGDPRRARPRLHHRRLPPRLRPDLQVPPQRHGRPREEAARGGRRQGQADRRRRRVLDGGRSREPSGDRGAQEPPRRAADGRRRARSRRLRRERSRHARALRSGARGRPRDGDLLQVAGRDRRLRRGRRARDRAHQAQREVRDLLRRAAARLDGRRAQGARADRARARAAQAPVGEHPLHEEGARRASATTPARRRRP